MLSMPLSLPDTINLSKSAMAHKSMSVSHGRVGCPVFNIQQSALHGAKLLKSFL